MNILNALNPLFGANVDPSAADPQEPFRRAQIADQNGLHLFHRLAIHLNDRLVVSTNNEQRRGLDLAQSRRGKIRRPALETTASTTPSRLEAAISAAAPVLEPK